ncbi:fimbrial family protein (plasmid) [Klebsiella oxytoca]|uniref:fimbrial protein n=1 Tax=Klebsiella oxytoca TaxID=571 RepID=UPI000D5285A7|nr:fimbrial protein [Klebsiella oxytoca]AWF33347.1 fimbrial family protein [Klebsiella oxytoca]
MKKLIFASLMPVLLMGSFSAFAEEVVTPPITVDGGKINFTGAIVAAPCAVDNTSDGQTVNLGQVPTNRISAKGDSSSAVPFTVKLIGCDLSVSATDPKKPAAYTSASITFNGATTVDDTTLAVHSAASGAGDTTSAAQNVGIQIRQNNTAVSVNGSKATAAQKIVPGTNEIPFSANYVATADGVVAGSANSTVNFQVTYQ